MDISPKQKEKANLYLRIGLTIVGGGIIISFTFFTLLTNLIIGALFAVLMFFIGILIGLYSTEIHYAILSGFLAIFMGLIILFGTLFIGIALVGAWDILDILILLTIDIVVRAFALQLLGMLPGVVIGQLLSPDWLEPKTKHKLKVGLDNKRISEEE